MTRPDRLIYLSRRSASLAEILVALAILLALVGIVLAVWHSQRRQSSQLERGAELVGAACLVQEALSWDMLRSLPPTVLPEPLFARGQVSSSLALPLMAGYQRAMTPSPEYRVLKYEFDGNRRLLLRAGRPLVSAGLDRVEFLWSNDRPTTLKVTLTGARTLTGATPCVTIQLSAPVRTDPPAHWRFAAHHQGARPLD